MMPEYGLGYWQCKLRYRTQDELLSVAREHKKRGLPMDAIVIDFFHWTRQGDFRFEPRDWPNPEAMVKELRELGIEPVVSVWPTVDEHSINFGTMAENAWDVEDAYTKEVYEGGQTVTVPAPLEIIPVMIRDEKPYDIYA